MKKYHQLLLLIISVVSLTLLLVYRHEYNRLHYVLEVFNFFGSPCNFSSLEESRRVLSQHDWGATPVWQETENGFFYSAFWHRNEAKALVLEANEASIPRSCYLWFEDNQKPTVGKFKYSKMIPDDKSLTSAYFYYCGVTNTKHVPYAVSFASKYKKALEVKKILLTNEVKSKIAFNTTLCVAPTVNFDKHALLEFLSYHKLIGIDSFVFYNENIPYRLSKLLTNLSNRLGYKIAFLPWNFPNNDVKMSRLFVENDCTLRTIDESKNVVTLNLFEYIVPTKYYSVNELFADFNRHSEILSLPVQEFCITSTERNKPVALQNTRVSKSTKNIVYNVYRNTQAGSVISTQILDGGFASIHKYVDCKTDTPKYSYNDNSILKYSRDFIRTTLVQLLIHNKI